MREPGLKCASLHTNEKLQIDRISLSLSENLKRDCRYSLNKAILKGSTNGLFVNKSVTVKSVLFPKSPPVFEGPV